MESNELSRILTNLQAERDQALLKARSIQVKLDGALVKLRNKQLEANHWKRKHH